MSRRFQVFDARGRPVDDDDAFHANGAIRDGFGLRVPLEFMDSTQKAVRTDAQRKKVTQFDPFGRVKSTYEEEEADSMMTDAELALHRPRFAEGLQDRLPALWRRSFDSSSLMSS